MESSSGEPPFASISIESSPAGLPTVDQSIPEHAEVSGGVVGAEDPAGPGSPEHTASASDDPRSGGVDCIEGLVDEDVDYGLLYRGRDVFERGSSPDLAALSMNLATDVFKPEKEKW